ncbi:MAG: hypothetical protein KJ630_15290 [Proteobacteria bacterium]|nr:hypothetical protein [Pseudomonadota bacterium]
MPPISKNFVQHSYVVAANFSVMSFINNGLLQVSIVASVATVHRMSFRLRSVPGKQSMVKGSIEYLIEIMV